MKDFVRLYSVLRTKLLGILKKVKIGEFSKFHLHSSKPALLHSGSFKTVVFINEREWPRRMQQLWNERSCGRPTAQDVCCYQIFSGHTELFRAFKTELHLFFSLLFIGKLNYMARSLVKCTIFATDYESLKKFNAKIIMRLPYKVLKSKARNL